MWITCRRSPLCVDTVNMYMERAEREWTCRHVIHIYCTCCIRMYESSETSESHFDICFLLLVHNKACQTHPNSVCCFQLRAEESALKAAGLGLATCQQDGLTRVSPAECPNNNGGNSPGLSCSSNEYISLERERKCRLYRLTPINRFQRDSDSWWESRRWPLPSKKVFIRFIWWLYIKTTCRLSSQVLHDLRSLLEWHSEHKIKNIFEKFQPWAFCLEQNVPFSAPLFPLK
jgi:hypothetical protein